MLEEKDYSKQELADALYAGNIVNGSDFLSFCELLLILGAIIAIIP